MPRGATLLGRRRGVRGHVHAPLNPVFAEDWLVLVMAAAALVFVRLRR